MRKLTIFGFCCCLIVLWSCTPQNDRKTDDVKGWKNFSLIAGEKVDTLNWSKCSRNIDSSIYNVYIDKINGFKIKVPNNWTLTKPDQKRILALGSPVRESKTKTTFSVIKVPLSSNPQVLADQFINKLTSRNFTLIGQVNILINGQEGKKYLLKTWIPNYHMSGYSDMYFVANNKHLFIFQGVTDSIVRDSDREVFAAIISSLQFINQ